MDPSISSKNTEKKAIHISDYVRFVGFALAFLGVTSTLFLISLLSKVILFWWSQERFEDHMHRVACLWGRGILFFTPGWNVEIHGLENLKAAQLPCVIVANHLSMTDIWAIGCMRLQFRWFAKAELFKIPMVGWGMRNAGYIPVDRNDPASRKKSFDRSLQVMRSGISMLFFPEGTRSEDGVMREFKIGAFKLAHETQVNILPIIVKNTDKLLPKHSLLPRAATVHVQILPLHVIREGETIEKSSAYVREKMELGLIELEKRS